MNLSGESVAEAARFHKIAPKNVIVFHDDLALPPGTLKIKHGGGSGGHNGLKSIDAHLGPDYWRVRIGIGHPGEKGDIVTQYVLGNFAKADKLWLQPLLDSLVGEMEVFLKGKTAEYAARIARKMTAVLEEKNGL
jgi:PTH1 family peptidyl-tRNA hydrolase